jgi:hypothetical protein
MHNPDAWQESSRQAYCFGSGGYLSDEQENSILLQQPAGPVLDHLLVVG